MMNTTVRPFALAALADTALPQGIVDVLNFALTLEYLESSFYNAGVGTSGLIPASDLAIFQQIQKHENAHVAFLESVLGSAAVAKPTFDFTAGGMFADVFSNYATFQAVSQAFEDTGVRAYKGQAARGGGAETSRTRRLDYCKDRKSSGSGERSRVRSWQSANRFPGGRQSARDASAAMRGGAYANRAL
jgi:hypothetical protein